MLQWFLRFPKFAEFSALGKNSIKYAAFHFFLEKKLFSPVHNL